MEKEELKWEQPELEEQEEEEVPLIVRKSRNGNDSKADEIDAVDVDVEVSTNGVSESNGHTNGAQSEETIFQEEQKIEELDGVLENETEPINGEEKLEELDGVHENETEPINGEKKLDGIRENKSEHTNGEKNLEELGGVLQNGSEAVNGEQKSEKLVFYDKAEGIWKCRICTWTYGNGSVCLDHVLDHKGLFHKLMNVKTLNFEYKGVNSASTYLGEKQIVKDPGQNNYDLSTLDFIAQDTSSATNNGYKKEDLHKDSFPTYNPPNEIESEELDQINDDDLEITDSEVERVITKQTTHDLFCPNCNSCITKRVILRKRKRQVRITEEEVKRNKIEADSKLISGSVQSPSDIVHHGDEVGDIDNQFPTAEEDERERGPDVFRCLSCFSFFIPNGNGFEFRIFGDKSGKVIIRDEQAPAVKKNWFTSIFGSNKQETAADQGSSSQTNMSKDDVGSIQSSNLGGQSSQPSVSQKARNHEGPVLTPMNNDTLEGTDKILPSPRQKPSNGKLIDGDGDKLDLTAPKTIEATMEQFDAYNNDQLKDSKPINITGGSDLSVTTLPKRTQVTNGESQQDGLKLLISSNKGSPTNGLKEGQISNQMIQSGNTEVSSAPVSIKATDVDGKLNISVSIPHEEQDIKATFLTDTVLENKNSSFTSSNGDKVYPTEASQHITTKTKFDIHPGEPLKVDNISSVNGVSVAPGKDAVITIDAPSAVPDIATETPSVSESATQTNTDERERREERNEYQIEVIKSIVYGGLAESITSLSIVSSAAGGGADTLNVLALGMANLIGGLFIIFHNLWDLKCERAVEHVSTQISDHRPTEQRDQYSELLGRRQNFILHAVVAIISYLVFGLVPPAVYGFSFRKTDDKQLKLLVVAATALVCIVMLALGRAHVRCRPKPYVQSVARYVILGVMVSGVSYAAGQLVERLLEKLGLFESGSVSNLLVPEMMVVMNATAGSGRASY